MIVSNANHLIKSSKPKANSPTQNRAWFLPWARFQKPWPWRRTRWAEPAQSPQRVAQTWSGSLPGSDAGWIQNAQRHGLRSAAWKMDVSALQTLTPHPTRLPTINKSVKQHLLGITCKCHQLRWPIASILWYWQTVTMMSGLKAIITKALRW